MIEIERSELVGVLRQAVRELDAGLAKDGVLALLRRIEGHPDVGVNLEIMMARDRNTGLYRAKAVHPADGRVVAQSRWFKTPEAANLSLRQILQEMMGRPTRLSLRRN